MTNLLLGMIRHMPSLQMETRARIYTSASDEIKRVSSIASFQMVDTVAVQVISLKLVKLSPGGLHRVEGPVGRETYKQLTIIKPKSCNINIGK